MTNEEFEPIRIRIMKEAYDLADRNDTEGCNAIKVMCSDVQSLMRKEPLTDEQINTMYHDQCNRDFNLTLDPFKFARAVERAHGIGAEE